MVTIPDLLHDMEEPDEAPSEGLTLPNKVSSASQRFEAGGQSRAARLNECSHCRSIRLRPESGVYAKWPKRALQIGADENPPVSRAGGPPQELWAEDNAVTERYWPLPDWYQPLPGH